MKNKKWFLKKLYINNFKPFTFEEGLKEIPFIVDGKIVDLMMLAGFNGYGKTSIFQAIEFALSGKVELFVFKDTNKKTEEHLIVNELGKESLIALEVCTEDINEVKTIIRYNKNPVARKENQCLKEYKDFDMFILNQSFIYRNFKNDIKNKNIDKKTLKDVEFEFGQTFLDEWIKTNYIKQEQSSNILFKTNKERVGFIDKFIDNELEDEILCLDKKINDLNISIKTNSEKLRAILQEQKSLKKVILGEEPKNSMIFSKNSFIWDKLIYEDKEPFGNYLKEINKVKNVFFNYSIYQTKFEVEIMKQLRKYNLKEIILFYSIKDNLSNYLQKARKKVYLENFIEKDLITSKSELSNLFIPEDIINQITEYRLDIEEINKLKNENDEVFLEIKRVRATLQKKSKASKEVFENICPLCGSEYLTKEKLMDAIKNYEEIFSSINIKLQKSMKILIENSDVKKNIILSKIKQEIFGVKLEKEIVELIIKINNKIKILSEHIRNVEAIGITIENLDCLKLENLVVFEKNLKEKLQLKEEYLIRISEDNSNFKMNIDNYDTFLSIKNYYELENSCVIMDNRKIESFITSLVEKEIYIKWLADKQDLQKNNNFEIQKNSQVTILRNLLYQERKLRKLVSLIKETKNIYMDKIISNIEIPLYIYSGKLLQSHQSGLGVFCTTGPTEGKFTQFKLSTNRGSYGHDIINKFSAGQKAIINVAVMLAFRKVRKFNLDVFLVDDPCQSMDDINIASLVEILRNEFMNTQLILSTHDDKIANYICYKYFKSGKYYSKFDVQKNLYAIEEIID